jgi:LAO/AO transport system kinase
VSNSEIIANFVLSDDMSRKKEQEKSALCVLPGIEQPLQVNENAVSRLRRSRKKLYDAPYYFEGIRRGDRVVLSQAITLVESTLREDQTLAQEIIEQCLPFSGNSIRIGITGVPGVGKSTFIEAFGSMLSARDHRIAVLAIDPSSSRTKGSILGDKTRMEDLSRDPNAFIRPSPSAGTLGGVARKTWETVILCEASGFDIIFIETVGVGQSETAVHSMADFFLLLMLAGAGDELQGIKRGIMEMADALIINKADGENVRKAQLAAAEYRNALALFPLNESKWSPPVLTCSARLASGVEEVWDMIQEYKRVTTENGYFQAKRSYQSKIRMHQTIEEQLKQRFYRNEAISRMIPGFEKALESNNMSAYIAAIKLLERYFDDIQNEG